MEQINGNQMVIIFCTNNNKISFFGTANLKALGLTNVEGNSIFSNGTNWVQLSSNKLPSDFIIILLNEEFKENGWEAYFTEKINELNSCPHFVYHNHTPEKLINYLQDAIKSKFNMCISSLKSLHEEQENCNETPYFKISKLGASLSSGLNDIQNIIDEIKQIISPSIEKYLDLLHQCLTPQGAKAANPGWLQGDAKTKYEALIKIEGDDPFANGYINALTSLRDELLKEF